MSDCLFCKIVAGDIPAEKIYEDDFVMAFKDINPSAKIHLLFIHKKHTANLNELTTSDPKQLTDIFLAIAKYTEESGLAASGFRTIVNHGADARQAVFHTHFHLLGGEKLEGF